MEHQLCLSLARNPKRFAQTVGNRSRRVPRRSDTIAAQLRNQVGRESVLSDTWSLYLAVYPEMYDDRRTPNRALRAYPCMGTYKSPISGEIALTRRILTLDVCLQKLATHDRSRRYAVLTFDDGYRDNLSVALPILERNNAPFMMYVPTGAPTRSMQSWWLGFANYLSQETRLQSMH